MMMAQQSPFVMEFMKMRQNLHKKTAPATKKTVDQPIDGITLATIVEKKPPIKDVVEYFKRRVESFEED